MRVYFFILIGLFFVGCTTSQPKDLKSPCVASGSVDSSPAPCVKRSVNTHWLG